MMKYFGGKFRIASDIATYIKYYRKSGQQYIEPFVGGLNVAAKVKDRPMLLCDLHRPLIAMYKALQNGWMPPDEISEEEHLIAKSLPDNDPLKAFIGFGCSFGCIYFGGYAKGKSNRNYALETKSMLLKQLPVIKNAEFIHCSYDYLSPVGAIIYCDPPYSGTSKYSTGDFDTDKFWDTMRKWSECNTVLISEYSAPDDFECIWNKEIKLSVRSKKGCEPRVEKLFMRKTKKQYLTR
jgi:DNA adenine methylase